jgi:hypothetical protein
VQTEFGGGFEKYNLCLINCTAFSVADCTVYLAK